MPRSRRERFKGPTGGGLDSFTHLTLLYVFKIDGSGLEIISATVVGVICVYVLSDY